MIYNEHSLFKYNKNVGLKENKSMSIEYNNRQNRQSGCKARLVLRNNINRI